MNRNKFTKREIQLIKNNPYTYKVTESQIFYTKEFKEEFWRRYQAGESPRTIVEALGYDPDMLGQYRINGLQINIQKQARRPEGLLCDIAGVSRSGYYAGWQQYPTEQGVKLKIRLILN